MIFSLLKMRRKARTALACIAIGCLCLYGIAYWQDMSGGDILNLLLGAAALLLSIIVAALLLVTATKLLLAALKRLRGD